VIVVSGGGRLPDRLRGGAIALGNFDGVHRGHQAVIGAAVERARAEGRPALVGTFAPHPARFFLPDKPPFALTCPEQKQELLAALGVDATVVIPFDAGLARLSAAEFAAGWLGARLGIAHAVTGMDFTFGKGRTGSVGQLAAFGRESGFTAEAVPPVTDGGAVISSTRIREALVKGDMAEATRLLGRPFAIRGPVLPGDRRGRTIGVPTANQQLGAYLRPRYGVYAARVRLADGALLAGVANLGVRPMFDPPKELLETWIFDWSGDLYGQEIDVQLIEWLRPELRLDGLAALRARIAEDERLARRILAEI